MAVQDYISLCEGVKGIILRDEPMSRHTSFRIGGPADLFVAPEDRPSLGLVLHRAAESGLSVYVIGAGSNLLVHDEGVRGVVLSLAGLKQVSWEEHGDRATLRADAGVSLALLVSQSAERGWSGLEPLAGIPGTLGGALCMNAGTKAGCIGDVVEEVDVITLDGREVRRLQRNSVNFGYRSSGLDDVLILGCSLSLARSTPEQVKAAVDTVRGYRKGQPTGMPNAGSVFKNPPGDFAGRLIEAAGCKGERAGGAMVSERHGNFIVNTGGATAYDVLSLVSRVQHRVFETTGIQLELELKII